MRSATRNRTGKDKAFRNWTGDLPCLVCFLDLYQQWLHGEMEFYQVLNAALVRERVRKFNGKGLIQQTPTEHAHVGDNRGASQKCSDHEGLPLCGIAHHREGPTSYHNNPRGKFFLIHGIDRDAFVAKLLGQYETEVRNVA